MRAGFRDQVADLFRAQPGQWIDSDRFFAPGGKNGWRTRISECRTQLGMEILNRKRTGMKFNGERFTISEYQYVPADVVPSLGLQVLRGQDRPSELHTVEHDQTPSVRPW